MTRDRIFEYDYLNGMSSQREKAFTEVMQNQNNYEFLKHKKIAECSKEEKQKIIDNINKRIARLTKAAKQKLQIASMAILLIFAIGLTSCDKQPIQREMITQELKLTNIYTMPMTKSFNPTEWVYEYNTEPALITFTSVDNPNETVTRLVTIEQLMQGITVTIYEGTYNITYQTVHSELYFTQLDIKIDMKNVIVNGAPIALEATYDDYLLIIDLPDVLSVYSENCENYELKFTKNQAMNVWYAYSNINNPVYVIAIRFNDGTTKTFTLVNMILGQIYWYTSPIEHNTTITFPNWTINKITL